MDDIVDNDYVGDIYIPNRKVQEKPYIERFFTCPKCGMLHIYNYVVETCQPVRRERCWEAFRIIPAEDFCVKAQDGLCNIVMDCRANGIATIHTRKMWKPYSLIKPRRLTRWE